MPELKQITSAKVPRASARGYLLVKKGAFASDVIWEEYSYYIEYYWSMLEPHVNKFRDDERDKSWFENFEALYNDMQKISKRRGVYVLKREGANIERFIKSEMNLLQERKAEAARLKDPKNLGT